MKNKSIMLIGVASIVSRGFLILGCTLAVSKIVGVKMMSNWSWLEVMTPFLVYSVISLITVIAVLYHD